MITILINGGLGNQLFQVFAALAAAIRNGDTCYFLCTPRDATDRGLGARGMQPLNSGSTPVRIGPLLKKQYRPFRPRVGRPQALAVMGQVGYETGRMTTAATQLLLALSLVSPKPLFETGPSAKLISVLIMICL